MVRLCRELTRTYGLKKEDDKRMLCPTYQNSALEALVACKTSTNDFVMAQMVYRLLSS
jgi:hypothetical protein